MTQPCTPAESDPTRWLLAVLVAAGVLLGGCSDPRPQRAHDSLLSTPVPRSVTVEARAVEGLGTVLTDGAGRTLYMFPPDAGSQVTCTGPCAGTWPPMVIENGRKPTAGAGVNREVLATLADPNTGAQIVTYSGYPLYHYAGDVSPGTANGQHLFLNGGPWYAMSPTGSPVTLAGTDR